nr:uncharacterized protein LOC109159918 [Ipomoea batatas]
MVIREVLSWLKNRNYDDITLETDAQLVLNELHHKNLSPYGLILGDICSYLVLFSNVSLCFVKRSANVVAHLLARDASLLLQSRFRFDTSPSFIVHALCNDLRNI